MAGTGERRRGNHTSKSNPGIPECQDFKVWSSISILGVKEIGTRVKTELWGGGKERDQNMGDLDERRWYQE
jgi:hypothetical protein